MSHAEYHRWLFKVATGWLGWAPLQAYMADMADIEMAHRGRIEMLKAIFGAGESEAPKLSLAEKVRAAMTRKGTEKVERKP